MWLRKKWRCSPSWLPSLSGRRSLIFSQFCWPPTISPSRIGSPDKWTTHRGNVKRNAKEADELEGTAVFGIFRNPWMEIRTQSFIQAIKRNQMPTNPKQMATVLSSTSQKSNPSGKLQPHRWKLCPFRVFNSLPWKRPRPGQYLFFYTVRGPSIGMGTGVLEISWVFLKFGIRSVTRPIIGLSANTNKMIEFSKIHCFLSRPESKIASFKITIPHPGIVFRSSTLWSAPHIWIPKWSQTQKTSLQISARTVIRGKQMNQQRRHGSTKTRESCHLRFHFKPCVEKLSYGASHLVGGRLWFYSTWVQQNRRRDYWMTNY